MPELPEVETTLRGIKPFIIKQKVKSIDIRKDKLRFPVPNSLKSLTGQTLLTLNRRGKYLLFGFKTGTLIVHLGMSGKLRVLNEPHTAQKHDHIDLHFGNHTYLRFTDPRRFGAWLWTIENPEHHPLLTHLGPEPLSKEFNVAYLQKRSVGRKLPIKSFIMDGKIVVGVGNIYATESLFLAGISPKRSASSLKSSEWQALVKAIKTVLKQAISKGGTTLRDFLSPQGETGYFSLALKVYGRDGKPCPRCKTSLSALVIGQRSSVYCKKCQK